MSRSRRAAKPRGMFHQPDDGRAMPFLVDRAEVAPCQGVLWPSARVRPRRAGEAALRPLGLEVTLARCFQLIECADARLP
jgi:hypothetical protein